MEPETTEEKMKTKTLALITAVTLIAASVGLAVGPANAPGAGSWSGTIGSPAASSDTIAAFKNGTQPRDGSGSKMRRGQQQDGSGSKGSGDRVRKGDGSCGDQGAQKTRKGNQNGKGKGQGHGQQ
jgi:hypothetical protein